LIIFSKKSSDKTKMVSKGIGLRGYVGEEIIRLWLSRKYGEENIVRQVVPEEFPRRGGPYLDFGILRNKVITGVCEVKTQDWDLTESGINKSLKYIWNNPGKSEYFLSQDRQRYKSNKDVSAFLVLLRAPKGELAEKLEGKFILFEQIFAEISPKEDLRRILDTVKRGAFEELQNIRRLSVR